MYIGRGDQFIPGISIERLLKEYHKTTVNKEQLRIKCALLRKKGKSIPTIARILNKRESTVSDILRRFKKRGISACYTKSQKGRPKLLSPEKFEQLKDTLRRSPIEQNLPFFFWTTRLITYFIKKKFNVTFSMKHVHRTMRSIGMSIYNSKNSYIKISNNLNNHYLRKADPELKKIIRQDRRSPYWIHK